MKFVGVEYKSLSNVNILGYIRIPESFSGFWYSGYVEYLRSIGIKGDIEIYPLNIHLNSDTMGKAIPGRKNLEDEFNMAIRSSKFYPQTDFNNNIRRAWSMMDPMSPDYTRKER